MFNFPYFGYPYHRPYYQYYNPQNYVDIQKNVSNEESYNKASTSKETDKENVQKDINSLDYRNNIVDSNDTPIFEIFGIKLYSDDLIILAVLFLLYEQNVKDEILYIILFLLLFS